MKIVRLLLVAFCLSNPLCAQVPQLINFQGRIAVDGVNFNGTGQFKFALINGDVSVSFWSNDGSSVGGSEPTNAAPIAVSQGLYSVLLGDATLTNMTPIAAAADSLPESGGLVLSDQSNATTLLNVGYIRIGQVTTDVDYWRQVGPNTPSGRYGHSAVWTGSEMIIWGGVGSKVAPSLYL